MTDIKKEVLNRCIKYEDDLIEQLKDPEFQVEYLNASLEEYIEDGDFKMFFKALERVIKSKDSLNNFAKNANLNRANLYDLFNGESKPKLETIGKILKELGYVINVKSA